MSWRWVRVIKPELKSGMGIRVKLPVSSNQVVDSVSSLHPHGLVCLVFPLSSFKINWDGRDSF